MNEQVLWPGGNCVKLGEWRFSLATRLQTCTFTFTLKIKQFRTVAFSCFWLLERSVRSSSCHPPPPRDRIPRNKRMWCFGGCRRSEAALYGQPATVLKMCWARLMLYNNSTNNKRAKIRNGTYLAEQWHVVLVQYFGIWGLQQCGCQVLSKAQRETLVSCYQIGTK